MLPVTIYTDAKLAGQDESIAHQPLNIIIF